MSVLDKAKKAVSERGKIYGGIEDNFCKISELWSVYCETSISPIDVAMMMILLKIARSAADERYEDNYIDIAGYLI